MKKLFHIEDFKSNEQENETTFIFFVNFYSEYSIMNRNE